MSNCSHIKELTTLRELPRQKGTFKFIDTGVIRNMASGEETLRPILRAMKETPSGMLTISLMSHWVPVNYCPECGTHVEPEPVLREPSHGN